MTDDSGSRLAAADARRQLRLLADAQLSRAIHVVATLGVADLLAAGPQEVGALAARLSCDRDVLGRLLRYLASAEVFQAVDGGYALTPTSRLLCSDEPGSLREELSIAADDRAVWWSTGELMHSVKTGSPAYDHVFGASLWDAMRTNRAASAGFQKAMTEQAAGIVEDLLQCYSWSDVRTVGDIGGGVGTAMIRLLRARPELRGILIDLPGVAAEAETALKEAGVADRCRVAAGDMFEGIPAGADRYLLLRILHDWPDEDALRILRRCREACAEGGRLLIVDMEVGPHDPTGAAVTADILMMLLVGGRERTQEEFAGLLGRAGFAVSRRMSLRSPYVALEARPE